MTSSLSLFSPKIVRQVSDSREMGHMWKWRTMFGFGDLQSLFGSWLVIVLPTCGLTSKCKKICSYLCGWGCSTRSSGPAPQRLCVSSQYLGRLNININIIYILYINQIYKLHKKKEKLERNLSKRWKYVVKKKNNQKLEQSPTLQDG